MKETDGYPSSMIKDLKKLIGLKITDMIKCSYDSFEEYTEYLGRTENLIFFFRHGFGYLLLGFNNELKYTFNYADDIHSVVIYEDKEDSLLNNPDLKQTINIKDFPDSSLTEFINKKIEKINILTENPLHGNLDCVPSEPRLEFIFENGKNLVLGLDLGELSDFSIMDDIILPDNVVIKYSIS